MSRDVVLVLRLVLDRQMELRHGELLDVNAVRQGRFVTLAGLLDAVQRWIDQQARGTWHPDADSWT